MNRLYHILNIALLLLIGMVTPLCAQTIRGNVFGGGQIAQVAGNTTVTIRTGSVEVNDSEGGNVYGGGEAANIIVGENGSGTTTVIVDGGTIDKSVYGGGHGNTTDVATSTTVTANGGTIGEDVYGGSGFGKVGATAVTINKRATVTRDVFGGGFGSTSPDYEADVNGNASVTINKGAIINGNVYGGNNTNGSPKGEISVLVDGPADGSEPALRLHDVFGGGKNAATTSSSNDIPAPKVTIKGCETVIARVFGGGDAASAPATDVEIWGGHIANAFAGGNGENVAAHIGYLADGTTPYTYGTGNTQITIKGGVIDNVFGGSNSAGKIRGDASVNVEKDDAACDVQITNLYGGGNKAPGKAGTINIVCTGNGLIENVFGGANAADINSDISLVITGGRINNVFGGNNNSGSINGTISVIVDWDEACDNNYLENVYGAGNLAQYSAPAGNDNYPRVVIRNATIEQNVYGGGKGDATRPSENLGQVTGNPQVFVGTAETDGHNNSTHTVTVKGSIYGGGDAAPVTGNPSVGTNGMTNAGVTINNYVFGGGLGATAKITGSTLVKILGNTRIDKNVYGGGFGGDVTGNTHVVIGGED